MRRATHIQHLSVVGFLQLVVERAEGHMHGDFAERVWDALSGLGAGLVENAHDVLGPCHAKVNFDTSGESIQRQPLVLREERAVVQGHDGALAPGRCGLVGPVLRRVEQLGLHADGRLCAEARLRCLVKFAKGSVHCKDYRKSVVVANVLHYGAAHSHFNQIEEDGRVGGDELEVRVAGVDHVEGEGVGQRFSPRGRRGNPKRGHVDLVILRRGRRTLKCSTVPPRHVVEVLLGC